MATFRTDPETGRTVISQDNIVSSGSTNPGRPGGESGERGDPVLSQQEFMNVTGRTATNPYGKQGFFSRVFGLDPKDIHYTSNIPGGKTGIAQLNALAYDRYMNPAARVNVFGDEVGGDPTTGQLRYGVQPGDLTRFGTAVPARREGIAGILDNLPFGIGMASRMFGSTPARVPGFDVQEVIPQLGLGGPQPGEGMDPMQLIPGENELLQTSPPRIDDRLTPMRFSGDQSGLGDELEEFPQAPIPTEMTASKRTVVADPSRMVALPPVPESSLPYVPTLDDEFSQQARQDLIEAERRRGDRLDFMLDVISEQPKAFEPRAPLPPMPISPPPMFNEQVDLTDPALYGLSGFRP